MDSARFVASSLKNLVNNLSEGIHIIKHKFEKYTENDDKKYETCGIKNKHCNCFFRIYKF